MRIEGRVVGCEACRELKLEQIQKNKEGGKQKATGAAAPLTTRMKKKISALEKSPTHKRKMLPGGEPEWWGAGVNRVLAVEANSMCVEEVEEDICKRTYAARILKSTNDRKVWLAHLKVMHRKFEEALSKTQGPEWFQDLSYKQQGLLDKMQDIVETDLQEGICARTQRALCDIGIHPPLPKNEVKRCMHECSNNTVRFLFMLHRVLVDIEQKKIHNEVNSANVESKPVQVFSINERLLLSGVFHVHFEEFTNKLNKILPPPPEKPRVLLPTKRPPQPKQKYSSPYLEPQPIAEKVWYEQRAEDDLYKEQAKLVALQEKKEFEKKVLMEAEAQKQAKAEKLRKLFEQKNYTFGSKSKKASDSTHELTIAHRENKSQIFRRFSEIGGDKKSSDAEASEKSGSTLGVSRSMRHIKKNRRYMYDVVHETIQTKTSFGGFFGQDNKLLKDSEGANLKIRLVPRNDKVICLYRDEDFKPVQVLDTRVRTCCRDVGVQTDDDPIFLPITIDAEKEFYKLLNKEYSVSDASTNTEIKEDRNLDNQVKDPEMPKVYEQEKPLNIECHDEACALINADIPMDEYDMMRRKIETYPSHKQLRAAVAFLCRRGDPMAILPKVHETPWLIRWFELRLGIKEVLTEEDKENLLALSQKSWKASYKPVSAIIVKPLKLHRRITTLDREWVDKKILAKKTGFQRKLRQQMVNNARDFYPAFFTEYFTSPLNKSMRKTFFTYLPSRELDTYCYRVWAREGKEAKAKSNDEQKEEN